MLLATHLDSPGFLLSDQDPDFVESLFRPRGRGRLAVGWARVGAGDVDLPPGARGRLGRGEV